MEFRRPLSATLVILTVFAAGRVVGHFTSRSEAQNAPAATQERSSAQIARERLAVADRGIKMTTEARRMGTASSIDEAKWVRRRALAANDLPDKAERLAVLEDCSKRMTQQIRMVQEMSRLNVIDVSAVESAKFDALEVELLLAKARESH